LSVAGCGGGATPAPSKPPPAAVKIVRPAAPAAKRPPGVLYRDEVVSTVEGGLGRFLQHVELEPSLEDGRFIGFRIVRLVPDTFWQGVDLKPGDVVTRVNGKPIERDIDAYQTFVALKAAPDLRVSYLREATPRELVFKIVDRPSGS
jgi:S1-C subfamily serine protease